MRLTSLKYKNDKTELGIFTSMSRLPVEFLYFYMPPSVFKDIGTNVRALSCSVKVTPHGIRTPWKTGETVVQPVNSDMMVYGVSAIGLNAHLNTGMCVPGTPEANNPMLTNDPVAFTKTHHSELALKYWGHTHTDADIENVPTCLGAPRHNKCYDFISHGSSWFRLSKYVNIYPFKSHVGTPILNYHYEFKNGWLSHGGALDEHADVYVNAQADDISHAVSDFQGSLDVSHSTSTPKTSKKPFGWAQSTDTAHYLGYIENRYVKCGIGGTTFFDAQPSVGFGLMAVSKKSLDLSHTKQTYQDVSAFYQVDSEIVLHHSMDSVNTQQIALDHSHTFYVRGNHGMDEPENAQTKAGRYTWRATNKSSIRRSRERQPRLTHLSVPFEP